MEVSILEVIGYSYEASKPITGRVHVGVVGSGDLEILMEPSADGRAHVSIRSSVIGSSQTWKAILDKFFSMHNVSVSVQINDFGATPGVVSLRLEQAMEALII